MTGSTARGTTGISDRQRFLFAILTRAGAALLILTMAFVALENTSQGTAAAGYAAVTALTAILLLFGKQRLAERAPGEVVWLHPPVLITLWVLGAYQLPGLYLLINRNSPATLEIFQVVSAAYVVAGNLMAFLGCLFIWVGYLSGLRIFNPLRLLRRLGQRQPTLGVAIMAFVVATVIQLIQIWVTGIAYGANVSAWGALAPFQQWLAYLQDLGLLVIVITALKTFRREWPLRALLGMVAVQVLFGLISGFMKPIFWLAVVLAACGLATRINLRRFVLPVVALILIGVFVIPVAVALRDRVDEGFLQADKVTQVFDAVRHATADTWLQDPAGMWEYVQYRMLRRQGEVAFTPSLILGITPSVIPYQGIEQFLAIPAYVIPRALWENKPVLSRGRWFYIVYWDGPYETTTSAAMTVFGEGYMFAGWLGVVLACTVLGLLVAVIYRNTVSAGLLPVFLALLPTFIDVEGQFTGIFVALIQKTIVFVFFYWVMVSLSRQSRNPVRRLHPRPKQVTSLPNRQGAPTVPTEAE